MRFTVRIADTGNDLISQFVVNERPSDAMLHALVGGGTAVFLDEDGDQLAINGTVVGAVQVSEVKEA